VIVQGSWIKIKDEPLKQKKNTILI